MSGAIPANWKMLALSQIAEIRLGKMLSAKAREDGLIQRPYLRNENVRWGTVDLSDLKVMGFKPEEIERYSVQPGDLVICEGGEAGRCAVYRGSASVMYQKAIHRLRPSPGVVTAEFLQAAFEYGIKSNRWFPRFSETTIQHLPLEKITAVEIPIPPPKEQQRIVGALDERLSELDASVASLERAERNLVRYRAAVLAAACSGKLVPTEADLARRAGRSYEPADQLLARILVERRKANTKAKYEEPAQPDTSKLPKLPEGWVWSNVAGLADVSGGLTKNSKRDGLATQLPYLRVANVYANRLALDEILSIGVEESELARVRLERGDLLVVEGNGSPDQIGRVALWNGSIKNCVHQNHIIKARFPVTDIGTWALWCLLSPQGRSAIKNVASSTSGLFTLSISKIETLPIPLPPLAEQERIAAEVDRHLSRADALAASIAQSKRRAQRLRRAILAAAFQGRLVSQDPNDEPASVLLDRIRAQAAAAEATTASAPRRGRPPAQPAAPVASASPPAMTPKRRGRPPGSKNKAKA